MAVASLIANQASFKVSEALAGMMSEIARHIPAEVVVGLPTLGMVFAPAIAQSMGLTRYVPMGYSRKYWYRDELSASVQSLTTPTQAKRIYLDPNQVDLIRGRRVLIVDDAVSTGGTLSAVITLLQNLGVRDIHTLVAMRQGHAWRDRIASPWREQITGVFDAPRLVWRADGWWPASA